MNNETKTQTELQVNLMRAEVAKLQQRASSKSETAMVAVMVAKQAQLKVDTAKAALREAISKTTS